MGLYTHLLFYKWQVLIMKNLETNKIVASILVAGLIALVAGKIANGLYHPVQQPEKRGYQVEVVASDASATGEPVAEVAIDIPALMSVASLEKGKDTFKKCAACHSHETGGANKVGPNLAGVVGANIGHHAGYTYSDALKAKGGKWTHEELFAFLKEPQKYAPGTKMSFAGIKKPEQIADIIKFLESSE
jgi:cytochrome c